MTIPVLSNHNPDNVIGRADVQPDGSLFVTMRDWIAIEALLGAFQQLVPIEGRHLDGGRVEVKSFKVYAFSVENQPVNGPPIDGNWYWVARQDGEWFPAVRDSKHAVGGWTNHDTWEDFDKSITQWVPIGPPPSTT